MALVSSDSLNIWILQVFMKCFVGIKTSLLANSRSHFQTQILWVGALSSSRYLSLYWYVWITFNLTTVAIAMGRANWTIFINLLKQIHLASHGVNWPVRQLDSGTCSNSSSTIKVQTPGYVPKKTWWVFWVHPPKKTHPKKPTLLL